MVATGVSVPAEGPTWLYAAAETATSAMLVVDRAGYYIFVNPAAERLFGRTRQEIIGRQCDDPDIGVSCTPRGESHVKDFALRDVVRTGQPADVLCEVHRADGTVVMVTGETVAVRNGRGAVVGAFTWLRDQSAETEQWMTCVQFDANVRALLGRSIDAVVVHRAGRIVWVNRAALSMLGFSTENAMVGHQVLEFVHPDEREVVRERIRAAVEEGRPAPGREERFVGAGGRVVAAEAASLPLMFDGVPSIVVIGRDVTERTRAEAERRRLLAEQRSLIERVGRYAAEWKSVVSSIADAVCVLDANGNVVTVNEAACEMLGATADEVIGMSVTDLAEFIALSDSGGQTLPVESRPSTLALRGEVSRGVEFSFAPRGSSERRQARMSGAPVRVDDRVAGAVLVIADITALKEYGAERERLRFEAEMQRKVFEDIVENAPAGVAVVSGPDFVFDVVNPVFQTLAPGIEMLGRPFAAVAPEAPEVMPILERVMNTGIAERGDDMPLAIQRWLGGPTEPAFFSFAVVRIWSASRQRPALLGIVIETTAQVRARKRIEELAELAHRRAAELQGVIETMSEGVFACDADAKITLANAAAMRLLGVGSLAEVQAVFEQTSATTRLLGTDGARLAPDRMPLARALAGAEVVIEEVLVEASAQHRPFVRMNAAAIRDSKGVIVGAVQVAHDVTDQVEFDRLKDEFIRIAAHELKTPVAVMKGYAQAMLRTTSELPRRQRESLAAIDRGADRIHRIVQQLVDLSQLHAGQLELVAESTDLVALVESVVKGLVVSTPRHRIRIAPSAAAMVRADRDALARVLGELLDNAIRYSPDGGDIDVGITLADGHATVSVRDHGVGIPSARQHRAFERFFRGHTDSPYDYGGMGVSLYISHEVIKRLGGRMRFESEEGRGSTFYVTLPLAGAS